MMEKFDSLIRNKAYSWKTKEILPKVMTAGEPAGYLTAAGAAMLDESGNLQMGIPLCPPEGDAGTGMVATNSVAPRTGNLSAGTSTFAMLVLEKPLSALHREIDMVTTVGNIAGALGTNIIGNKEAVEKVNVLKFANGTKTLLPTSKTSSKLSGIL